MPEVKTVASGGESEAKGAAERVMALADQQQMLIYQRTDRLFADLRGSEPGNADGMKVDIEGNIYTGGAGGIYVLDPKGKKLGRIIHGQPATTNIGFGGDDWKTLFFTSRTHLGAVNLKIAGLPVPAPKK